MDLFATLENPAPPDAIVSAVRTRDGLTLRVVRWVARDARGTVVLAMGRCQFIEEYFEVAADLLARRFDVVIADWRGQGQSEREIAWRHRGHVSHFAAYGLDLTALEEQILQPFTPRPWYGLGHSMGAAILLDQAHAGLSPFRRLVLCAPMIDLSIPLRNAIGRLTAVGVTLGFGSRMVPGGSEASMFTRGFANNPLTSDPARYERLARTTQSCQSLTVGAPTMGWLRAAFRTMNRFRHPRFATETATPILIVAAGADRIVNTGATERFAARLKAGRCITIADARHEIMMECDPIREQFWAAFDAFVPGYDEDARARPSDQSTTTLAPTETRW